ncbi:MAG: fumarylacetoacetate hydrolase family protein [Nitrospiraceae bacterium]|nr:fumarylacetoacetate hydrolase family protein [Nitrospiraceae bacterium]
MRGATPLLLSSYRRDGNWRAAISCGPLLADVADLNPSGRKYPSTVRGLLESGTENVQKILRAAETAFEDRSVQLRRLEETVIGPPVPDPDKIICLGLNYREHASEIRMEVAPVPTFFAKFRNALCGPYSPIVLPAVSTRVDYEGELAVVIGRRCRDVSGDEALGFVAGYTIMNDVSARDLQMQTSQWTAGKTPDTFAPMGPGIVPTSSIPDPQNLKITTRVNGVALQEGHTSEMIFPVARTIAFLSSFMTLEPGDIISTGTPAGVGFKRQPPIFLKAGDLVEVEVERIGTIRNPVVGSLPRADRTP